jgi:iron complex outermembrane receptor protein
LRTADEQGGEGRDVLFAGTMRKTVGAARLQAFAGEYRYHRTGRFRLSLSPGAETLPAEIERGRYLGQSWATEEGARRIAGALADVELTSDWSLSALAVFAQEAPDRRITQLFADVGSDGLARNIVIVSPEQRSHSYSGELRLGRVFETAAFTHAAALNARFRASRSRFGGERAFEGERIELGERSAALAVPDFDDSRATLSDRIDQQGFGITYQLSMPDRFRVGGGLLYSDYSKRFTDALGLDASSDSAPWLYNASAALLLSERLELYGSYSRGLEEAGIAPTTAANANAILEAAIATQKELGLRLA